MDCAFQITENLDFDLSFAAGDLQSDGGLKTAVLISLFTDARENKQRGWWGGNIGSKLWLLNNAKRSNKTLQQAKEYAQEALAWLVSEGICKSANVETFYNEQGWLVLSVNLKQPAGNKKYDLLWRQYDAL